MRRKGQSLEFREYSPYTPGDDIRFVDWRASARHGADYDLVVRSFVAEEQLRLVISVDTRSTMHYPQDERRTMASKILVACWLAEALAQVALESGDTVYIHQLFDATDRAPAPAMGDAQLRSALNDLWTATEKNRLSTTATQPPVNLPRLRPFLPPTTVWLIVTDCYFEKTTDVDALAAMIAQVQAGMCWVLLVELDSLAFELGGLGAEVWQIPVPGGPSETVQFDPSNTHDANRKAVEEEIEKNRQDFLKATCLDKDDYRRWPWPDAELPKGPDFLDHAADFFNSMFVSDHRIQSIFVKQTI